MSSAAVSNRQFQPSPHARDQYYPQQGPNVATSPASTRKAVRSHPGSNGSSTHSPPITSQPHHSPSGSHVTGVTTPRAQPAHPSSITAPTMQTPPGSAGPPIAPPPRTSSHRGATTTPMDPHAATRRTDERSGSSRHQAAASSSAASPSTHEQRRRTHHSPRDAPAQQPGSSSGSRSKQSPGHSRSETHVGGTNLPHEDSTIINRVVTSDPQEDLAREQERMQEARPIPKAESSKAGNAADPAEGTSRSGRSRQDHSKSERRKETKFGDYILGQTIGEGEFGKVKMGWKREGGVQVAIKLIRRESLGTNPSRLPKIHREIAILGQLQHPNIVRLHEMVETERHIGIILEYASGGELFDYILNHRYLKDNAARRLFAQLVSGVGYLHKKGIIHRDLKLENLLLDRNRNIIITDFGFANTFNPHDELDDEIELNLGNRDFVKRAGLDNLGPDGHRRGDLMQTSCGSPCYAAPELVVSDSLYTGRKVDVWSCGVILYAMLAGYLPFDDDPANPDGDNINLLYKYIVSTPLTFPEYVTPHARDLLKRILVPDPRKRADLFEVARHSWLSEYSHVVGFITSSTTTTNDIANTTVPAQDNYETPSLARSASVREPTKPHAPVSPVGGLASKQGTIDQTEPDERTKQRDAKRRTVQVEYVAPSSSTQRGDGAQPTTTLPARTRTHNQGFVEAERIDPARSSAMPDRKSERSARPPQRATSDSRALDNFASTSATRPSTGGSISGARLPSRGNSYGLPSEATVAQTNVTGHFSQPPRGKQYSMSGPPPMEEISIGRPSTQRRPSNYDQLEQKQLAPHRGHKRSSTLSGMTDRLFGRSGSIFGGARPSHDVNREKKSYPPTSMPQSVANDERGPPRKSTESRRTSFAFHRNTSNQDTSAPASSTKGARRFSSLFSSSNLMGKLGGTASKDHPLPPGSSQSSDPRIAGPPRRASR
ncbi:Pkinase-domain-containing protein, partial [Eremomyces bilateralis CBS 781.70]